MDDKEHVKNVVKYLKPYLKDLKALDKKNKGKIKAIKMIELYQKHFGNANGHHLNVFFRNFLNYERFYTNGAKFYRKKSI